LALTLSAANLVAFVLAAFLAWLKCGRDIMPVGAVLSIALYILGKARPLSCQLLNKTEPLPISTIIDVKV
jgi:hypothetical protein